VLQVLLTFSGGILKRLPGFIFLFTVFLALLSAQDSPKPRQLPLPTSKVLATPSPGRISAVNSFPATIALSPDGRYAALLNNGYGTQQTQAHQSIAILDLKTNQLSDFPDARLSDTAHQSYFLGFAFSSDGGIFSLPWAQSLIPRAPSRVTPATASRFTNLREGR
jgi:hypothetical protein